MSEEQDKEKNTVQNLNYNNESSFLNDIYPAKDDFIKYKNNDENNISEEKKEETETDSQLEANDEDYGIYKKYL